MQHPERLYEMRSDPASIAPERAVVFEVSAPIDEFYRAAALLGFEFLVEEDESFESNDEVGGTIVAQATIAEIGYDAVLVDLPASQARHAMGHITPSPPARIYGPMIGQQCHKSS